MTPYYKQDGIVIYHGDCFDVIPSISKVDTVVADPPFFMPAQHYAARSEWARAWGDTSILARWWSSGIEAIQGALRDTGNLFVFCDDESYPVFYPTLYTRFTSVSALVWAKGRIGMGSPWRHSHEFILHARHSSAKWCGGAGESDVLEYTPVPSANRSHPVDKPTDMLGKLISVTTIEGDLVLDPFLGGGSTLIAARALKRRAIGIEIEERYCEIAAKRLAQGVLDFGEAA